jgi:hypothetical protein
MRLPGQDAVLRGQLLLGVGQLARNGFERISASRGDAPGVRYKPTRVEGYTAALREAGNGSCGL